MQFRSFSLSAACLLLLSQPALLLAEDWPQWRGPNRDDVSKETGLLKQWPEGGPKRVWLYENAGQGYSGYSIVGGKLFTMGTRDGKEVLLALDANSGKELWATPMGKILGNRWGDGPRGTPTVDGETVYALGGDGTLVSAQAADGKVNWTRTMQDLGGKTPGWGYTESVLVDGDHVICTPGGDKGTIAALNKKTGEPVWQSKDWNDPAQYASIVKAQINGEPQYVQLTMSTLGAVSPKDGSVLWKTPFPGRTAVIPTPIVHEDHVFVTAGYGIGSMLYKIEKGNEPKEIYANKLMKNHHGGAILVDKHVYGYSDGVGWLCMDFFKGEQTWAERDQLGKGAIGYADGMLYCLDEGKGTVALVAATPEKPWDERGRFTLEPQSKNRSPQGRIWTHPVISNGKLYLRDQEYIYCYDVKQ